MWLCSEAVHETAEAESKDKLVRKKNHQLQTVSRIFVPLKLLVKAAWERVAVVTTNASACRLWRAALGLSPRLSPSTNVYRVQRSCFWLARSSCGNMIIPQLHWQLFGEGVVRFWTHARVYVGGGPTRSFVFFWKLRTRNVCLPAVLNGGSNGEREGVARHLPQRTSSHLLNQGSECACLHVGVTQCGALACPHPLWPLMHI